MNANDNEEGIQLYHGTNSSGFRPEMPQYGWGVGDDPTTYLGRGIHLTDNVDIAKKIARRRTVEKQEGSPRVHTVIAPKGPYLHFNKIYDDQPEEVKKYFKSIVDHESQDKSVPSAGYIYEAGKHMNGEELFNAARRQNADDLLVGKADKNISTLLSEAGIIGTQNILRPKSSSKKSTEYKVFNPENLQMKSNTPIGWDPNRTTRL
jgi:hypothetical protein